MFLPFLKTKFTYICRLISCKIKVQSNHRYRPDFPEPASSLSWHGLQLHVGVLGFSSDQNNHDSLSSGYVLQSEREQA